MSDSVTRSINSAVQKTYEWLVDVEQELHTDDRQVAYHALRAVLHALRDRLPVEEAAHLAAELPILLRGLYYEGWRPSHKPEKLDRDEFLARVAETYDASPTLDPLWLTHAVLAVLDKRVAAGEMSDVRGTLPKDFMELWPA
ncbi:MAG: DUF2267 domain-containing protein [Akkermansiaceae bacterium]